MFGLKWLWKSNKQNIDTSNFVSKDFLTTTLTDYVLNNSLNTTLSNYLTTNTAQTITGEKTFSSKPVSITTSNAALKFKPNANTASYMEFYNGTSRIGFFGKTSASNNDIELNASGYLYLRSGNMHVRTNTLAVSENSDIWLGRNIYAGHNDVKFIPRTTTIKNLQFYDTSPGDNRHFNLLIPEPTTGNNPATRNYVDTTKNTIDVSINSLSTNLGNRINVAEQNITDLQRSYESVGEELTDILNKLGVNLKQTNLTIDSNYVYSTNWGDLNGYYFNTTTVKNIKLLGAVVHYGTQAGNASKAHGWMFNYGTVGTGNNIYFTFKKSKTDTTPAPVWNQTTVKVFYIDNLTARDSNENEEIFKFVKESK